MSLPVVRARQNEGVRAAILSSAIALVNEVGYNRLTVEGIAKKAGAGKQTIYRWWSSKAMILLDALVERVQRDLKFDNTGDFRADLVAQMGRVTSIMEGRDTACSFIGLLVEAQFDLDLAQAMNERIYKPAYEAATSRVRAAQDIGQLDPDMEPELMVELLYSPIYYRLVVPYASLGQIDVAKFVDMTLLGLAARTKQVPE